MSNLRKVLTLAVAAAAFVAAPFGPTATAEPASAAADHVEYLDETVELLSKLPIQESGRVKPLSTYAKFALLGINGSTGYKRADGEKRKPMHWMLDCLFQPEYAKQQPVFMIANDEVLDAVGLDHAGRKKRDRYTYLELLPARREIGSKGTDFQHIDPKERTPVQAQTVALAGSIAVFERLIHHQDFARRRYATNVSQSMQKVFEGAESIPLSTMLENIGGVAEIYARVDAFDKGALGHASAAGIEEDRAALDALLNPAGQLAERATTIAFFPPPGTVEEAPEWLSPGEVYFERLNSNDPIEPQIKMLAALERLTNSVAEPTEFHGAALELHSLVSAAADDRGEYSRVPMEVSYYKNDYFFRAQWLFLLGFILAGLTWLWPQTKWLSRSVWVPVLAGLAFVTIGITYRCIIRDRPPVSTLYETILFVTGTGVAVTLVAEWINRQRIALAISALMGTLGMFLAYRYEMHEAQDTMPTLVAVLDTNFWLATHVTSVTIGYAAGLFAAAVAHVWLIGKMVGLKANDAGFYKGLTRMTYGLIAFSLVFSVVGTILGGIWANDSWGRFWGWDPKENGALMICLAELIILHARMGGYIRDRGLAVLTVANGAVVAFSWWGVNLLGIGLHSYGFTSGAAFALQVFYSVEFLVIAAATTHWLATRGANKSGGGAPPAPPVPPTGRAATG